MELPKRPRSLILFYVLVVYVLLQLGWWAYMLVDLNEEIYRLKLDTVVESFEGSPEYFIEKGKLDQYLYKRLLMILGEGSVFFIILIIGIWKTRQSFQREVLLANQQKNFLLSITHELKSPITSVKLYLQTLMKRQLNDEKRGEITEKAIAETERLHSLVETLLLATKVDQGDYTPHLERLNFSELTEKSLEQFEHSAQKELNLERQIQQDIYIEGDELALKSILQNLFENAMKYSDEPVRISVNLEQANGEGFLRFADNGNGIPDSEKDKVFNKFYRVGSEETRKTKGTGLGLYIVKRLVEKHNGEILVMDNSPSGAAFLLKFKSS